MQQVTNLPTSSNLENKHMWAQSSEAKVNLMRKLLLFFFMWIKCIPSSQSHSLTVIVWLQNWAFVLCCSQGHLKMNVSYLDWTEFYPVCCKCVVIKFENLIKENWFECKIVYFATHLCQTLKIFHWDNNST